jgi:hypothetical protein
MHLRCKVVAITLQSKIKKERPTHLSKLLKVRNHTMETTDLKEKVNE